MSAKQQTSESHEAGDKRSSIARTAAAGTAGTAAGRQASARAADAKRVADAIKHTHSAKVAQASSAGDFVKQRAGDIRSAAQKAAAEGGKAGGREQLKGHFIEALDVQHYNAKNLLRGKKLVPRAKANNPAYDASKIVTRGPKRGFAGAVQQKSSAQGTEKAIAQMNKVKPGSSTRGALRVPKDQVAAAQRKALDATGKPRIRVEPMDFTTQQAGKKLDQGIADVAQKGVKAGSQMRALAKGGLIGAGVGVAIGSICDAKKVKSGEVNGREFAENRAVDAAEGATSAVAGTLAASAGAAGTTALFGTTAGASFAVSAGAAGTAVVGSIGGMGAGGAAVAGVLGTLSAPVVLPAAGGVLVACGAGFLVAKAFGGVRGSVKDGQRERRAREAEARDKQAPEPSIRNDIAARKADRLYYLRSRESDLVRTGGSGLDRVREQIAQAEAEMADVHELPRPTTTTRQAA